MQKNLLENSHPEQEFAPNKKTDSSSPSKVKHSSFSSLVNKSYFWFGLALLVYLWSTGIFIRTGTNFNYYSWQAYGWTEGKLWLPNVTEVKLDLTYYAGHWYNAFPPVPAVIMWPFVLLWGLNANQIAVSLGLAIINVLLIRLSLLSFSSYYYISKGTLNWLTLLFGFGTIVWQGSIQGSVWYFAQTCAVSLLLLSMLAGFRYRNPFATGLLVGLAGLSRPTCWLTLLFWIIFFYKVYTDESGASTALVRFRVAGMWTFNRKVVTGIFWLIAGPIATLFFMFFYNWLRFGSVTDFGYQNMSVNQWLKSDLKQYGQFSLHYLGKNFYYAFLNIPVIEFKLPFIKFDQVGNSLFAITPAFLLVPFAARHLKKPFNQWVVEWSSVLTFGAGFSVFTVLSVVLVYYNTGEAQLGYRFILDCLPFLIILIALAWPQRRPLNRLAIGLVILSVAVNFMGVAWFQAFWPEIFDYFEHEAFVSSFLYDPINLVIASINI